MDKQRDRTPVTEISKAFGSHGIHFEMWLEMDGYSVETLLKDPKFPNTPDIRALAHSFKEPPNLGESYGSRLYAWFAPPETGNYQFLISSNHEGQLLVSIDDKPENKRLVAYVKNPDATENLEFDKLESQKSPIIPLIKNSYYYVEGLHKELFGTDNFGVGVIFPNGTRNAPIDEKYCYYYYKSSTFYDKVSNPEEAGMKAAAKASEDIMARARLKAVLAAKIEAKEEVDKLLNLKPLPAGTNVTVNQSIFADDTSIYKVVKAALKSKKKITAAFWKATGESLMTNLTQLLTALWTESINTLPKVFVFPGVLFSSFLGEVDRVGYDKHS